MPEHSRPRQRPCNPSQGVADRNRDFPIPEALGPQLLLGRPWARLSSLAVGGPGFPAWQLGRQVTKSTAVAFSKTDSAPSRRAQSSEPLVHSRFYRGDGQISRKFVVPAFAGWNSHLAHRLAEAGTTNSRPASRKRSNVAGRPAPRIVRRSTPSVRRGPPDNPAPPPARLCHFDASVDVTDAG